MSPKGRFREPDLHRSVYPYAPDYKSLESSQGEQLSPVAVVTLGCRNVTLGVLRAGRCGGRIEAEPTA